MVRFKLFFVAVFVSLFVWPCLEGPAIKAEEPAIQCVITLDKAVVTAGEPITASWTISGENGPYQILSIFWAITEANSSEDVVFTSDYSSGSSTLTPAIGESGRFILYVADFYERWEKFSSSRFTINGGAVADPLEATFTMDKSSVAVGEDITASWTITGGEAPLTVTVGWYVTEDNWSSEQYFFGYDAGNRGYFRPSFGTSGCCALHVSDAQGRQKDFRSPAFLIESSAIPEALEAEYSLDKYAVAVGQPINASWTISGGVKPYDVRCTWVITEANNNQEWLTGTIEGDGSEFIPKFGISGAFRLFVTDAEGRESNRESFPFSITGAAAPPEKLTAVIALDKEATAIGEPIKATWAISGGTAPYKVTNAVWTYYEVVSGPPGFIKADVTGNTSVLIPVAGTSGSFHLSIEDDYGRTAHLTSSDFIITAGSAKPGDATSDGTIDILDLVSIIDWIVSNASPASQANADANSDGTVDILDLVWVIDRIMGG